MAARARTIRFRILAASSSPAVGQTRSARYSIWSRMASSGASIAQSSPPARSPSSRCRQAARERALDQHGRSRCGSAGTPGAAALTPLPAQAAIIGGPGHVDAARLADSAPYLTALVAEFVHRHRQRHRAFRAQLQERAAGGEAPSLGAQWGRTVASHVAQVRALPRCLRQHRVRIAERDQPRLEGAQHGRIDVACAESARRSNARSRACCGCGGRAR